MGYEAIRYDVADGVATITLNRPDRLNALNKTLSEETATALKQAAADDAVRCVVLTGAGRGFCAGADLGGFDEAVDLTDTASILRNFYHPVVEGLVTMPKPTVASVNGVAAGAGASLAFACDFRVATEGARFILAFIKIGLVPDCGATYFLPRLIGFAKAMEMAMTGEAVGAEEALRIGLVTHVVSADKLEEETRSFSRKLAEGPTIGYAKTREALLFGATADLHAALDNEARLQSQAAQTADFAEGVAAFNEKRPPKFGGR